MTFNHALVTSALLMTIAACDNSSYSGPQDLCNDQAWDQCADIARRQCNLSSTSSDRALRACRPYAACEDAAFDSCMDEHN